jgi:parallel beta helix pectate lyase-like protein
MDLVTPTRRASTVRELVSAVAQAADGEVVAIAPGEYALPSEGLQVRTAITLIGANPAPNRIRSGTRLRPAVENGYGIVVTPEDGNVTIANLTISPDRQQPASVMPRAGILVASDHTIADITLSRCTVWHMGGSGIHVQASSGSVNALVIEGCVCCGNSSHGAFLKGVPYPRIAGGYFAANARSGLVLDQCTFARVRDVAFEANQRQATDPVHEPELYLRGGYAHVVDACVFEDFAQHGPSRTAIVAEDCHGGSIAHCLFQNPQPGGGTAIQVLSASDGIAFEANTMKALGEYVRFDRAVRAWSVPPAANVR